MKDKVHTWEEAIVLLRRDPLHQQLLRDSYLLADRIDNCKRFLESEEFKETLQLINFYAPGASNILDLPAGNGIASYAFARNGYQVVAVDPDLSDDVGLGAVNFIKANENIVNINMVSAFGEQLPFEDESFDIVYVRQGLHHARDLKKFLSECYRVLRPGGLLFSSREHVVDNYNESLKEFLDAQPDHQLYQGENAFLLKDYLRNIRSVGFRIKKCLGPFESSINLHPKSFAEFCNEIDNYPIARVLRLFLPLMFVRWLMLYRLSFNKFPGRLFSFIALK